MALEVSSHKQLKKVLIRTCDLKLQILLKQKNPLKVTHTVSKKFR